MKWNQWLTLGIALVGAISGVLALWQNSRRDAREASVAAKTAYYEARSVTTEVDLTLEGEVVGRVRNHSQDLTFHDVLLDVTVGDPTMPSSQSFAREWWDLLPPGGFLERTWALDEDIAPASLRCAVEFVDSDGRSFVRKDSGLLTEADEGS